MPEWVPDVAAHHRQRLIEDWAFPFSSSLNVSQYRQHGHLSRDSAVRRRQPREIHASEHMSPALVPRVSMRPCVLGQARPVRGVDVVWDPTEGT
jgi:hypothetical protein